MKNNLELWNAVEKTDPKHTKKAKVGGNNITSIKPQYQILQATKQWGSYGAAWGFRDIYYDYSITSTPTTLSVQNYTTKEIEEVKTVLGLVGFKATFFYPDGQFEVSNSIKIFTDNKHSKIDDNYAKKVETDALTKALSKLGFNADVFMGRFDDLRYVAEVTEQFKEKPVLKSGTESFDKAVDWVKKGGSLEDIKKKYTITEEDYKKLEQIKLN